MYNGLGAESDFDQEHYELVKQEMEDGVEEVNIDNNFNVLNTDISIDEVKDAVVRAKLRKAAGVDDIPAEVLKNDSCIQMLHRLIQRCFAKGMGPEDWNRGIISPIPKSSSNDPYIPTNYRGITLISVLSM